MIRRLLTLAAAAVIALTSLSVTAYAYDEDKLKFDGVGKFTIVQFSDTHNTDQPYDEMIKLIEAALDTYNPNLAVFTGDNVTGGWFMSTPLSVKNAIDCIASPCEEREIPFAAVFGNHDWQTLCPERLQIRMYQSYDMCLMKKGFSVFSRNGNYNLTIKDSAGAKDIFNLWFFDSGAKDLNDNITGVNNSQISWYEQRSAELGALNGGEPLPSIVFQHIPVIEVNKLYLEVPEGTEGAISYNGKHVILDPSKAYAGSGELKARSGVPVKNNGQYESFVKTGDVVAAFFGHDHTNDFVGKTEDGIILGSTKTSGFESRGDGKQGFRVIVLDENDLKNIETFSVYYKDLVGGEIPEPKREYDIGRRLESIFTMIKEFLFIF